MILRKASLFLLFAPFALPAEAQPAADPLEPYLPQAAADLGCAPRPDSPALYASAKTGKCTPIPACKDQVFLSYQEACVASPRPGLIFSSECVGFLGVADERLEKELGDRKDEKAQGARMLLQKDLFAHMAAIKKNLASVPDIRVLALAMASGQLRGSSAAWTDHMMNRCNSDPK